jgi:ABC-type multidrug transport system fused ATPase/permease subunit
MLAYRWSILLSWVLSAIQLAAYAMLLWLIVDVLERLFGYAQTEHGLAVLNLLGLGDFLPKLSSTLLSGPPSRSVLLVSLLLGMVLFMIMQAARLGRLLLLFRANLLAISAIRSDLFRAFMHASLDDMTRFSTGRANSLVINDVNQMRSGFIDLFDRLFHQPLQLAIFACLLAAISPPLLLSLLWVVPLSLALIVAIGAATRRLVTQSLQRIEELESRIVEALSQLRLVKSYGGEEHECRRFSEHNHAYFRALFRLDRLFLTRGLSFRVLTMLVLGVVALIGGLRIMDGRLEVDAYVRFLALLPGAVAPLESLATIVGSLMESHSAASRIFVVINRHPVTSPPAGKALPRLRSGIEFQDACVRKEEREILAGVSFRIERGERAAIVGPSGAGKSTILSVLLGLTPLCRGRVLIDGIDIREIAGSDLRRTMHAVLQEEALFNTTLAENLCYPGRNFREAALLAAARPAQAAELLTVKPGGLSAIVGHRGTTFSGGEVQRLAITRALLGDPDLILLDEALSGLDAETEHRVLEGILQGDPDRTIVLATHRLASVSQMDRIILIEGGRVVDQGTHEELLSRCALYSAMVRLQSMMENMAEQRCSAHST